MRSCLAGTSARHERGRSAGADLSDRCVHQSDYHASHPVAGWVWRLSGRRTEKLGGRVSVESRRDAGTTIRITLPHCGGHVSRNSHRGWRKTPIYRADRRRWNEWCGSKRRTFKRSKAGKPSRSTGARWLWPGWLAHAGIAGGGGSDQPGWLPPYVPAIILGAGDQRVAFAVDAVLDEQEVLVKRFGKPLLAGAQHHRRHRARLRPGGSHSQRRRPQIRCRKTGGVAAPAAAGAKPAEAEEARPYSWWKISITSRMLLKGIHESAGYRVKTAVDGLEAFTLLRTQHFDLVVSDVEMHRA